MTRTIEELEAENAELRQEIEDFKQLKVRHIEGHFDNGKADVKLLLEPHPLMALLVESLRQFVGDAPNYQAVEVDLGKPNELFRVIVVRPNGKSPERRNGELMGWLDDIIDGVEWNDCPFDEKAYRARDAYRASRPPDNCNAHLFKTQ
jgi:hypothetical protein